MPFWDGWFSKPEEEEKGRISDTTGLGPALKGGSSDNLYGRIEALLKEVVGGTGKPKTRIQSYVLEGGQRGGQREWIVYLEMPIKQVVAGWQDMLTLVNDEKTKKEEVLAGYLEQFKGEMGLVANIQLLRKSGVAKEYREAKGELEEFASNVAGLESRVEELKTSGYWVEVFPDGGKYAVYPHPSVMEVRTSSSNMGLSSVSILLNQQQLEGDNLKLFHSICEKLAESIQEEYGWLNVDIGYSESTVFYNQPLSKVRGRMKAKTEPEKEPEKKPWWRSMTSL